MALRCEASGVVCEVRDLLDDFASYWEAAAELVAPAREAPWRERYESRHPDVFEHYFDAWGSRQELVPPALGELDGTALRRRGAQLVEVVEPAAGETCEVLGVRDVPLRFVVMVGLNRADGWVHRLEGRDTVFFRLERLPDPDAYRAMVAHETAHLLHLAARPDHWPDEAVGLNLLVEGLAVATAREVDPAASWAALFSVPDWERWQAECLAAWPEVVPELLERFDQPDRDQYRRFFWPDWIRRHGDVPERIGYFIGYKATLGLSARYPLDEIVRWPAARATEEVRAVLELSVSPWSTRAAGLS
jgi:hypothetical protein